MTAPVPDAVVRAVLACTDRHPIPPAGSDLMHIIPAPRVPVGEPTDADRVRACERLSQVHGREIRGGFTVEQLSQDYATCRLEGYEQAQRETQAVR